MNRTAQWVILLIAAIVTLVLIYYFDPAPNSFEFHKQFYKSGYQGVVRDIFIDAKNHSNKTILCIDLDNTSNKFKVHTPKANNDIFEIVNYGDTIIKQVNSAKILIIQPKQQVILEYELIYSDN